jgi:hypothetical protein
MAWEEAGRHPQWPQVADAMIEARLTPWQPMI